MPRAWSRIALAAGCLLALFVGADALARPGGGQSYGGGGGGGGGGGSGGGGGGGEAEIVYLLVRLIMWNPAVGVPVAVVVFGVYFYVKR